MRTRLLVLGLLAAMTGCGGGDEGETGDIRISSPGTTADEGETGEADSSTESGKQWDPALGTATVKGVVMFVGDPPRRRPIDMAGKAECAQLHSTPVLDESVIVGSDGGLQNTFVWISRGLEGWQFPTPTEPVVLNQKGCQFSPHVVGVQTGQPITIRNSDPFAHNVHALADRNTGFNFTQSQQGSEDQRSFSRRDVLVYVKCDIHGWMSSYVGVVPHPFFAVTGGDGTFELAGLPPGEYTLSANHEALGHKSLSVVVNDNETADVEFSFEEQ